MNSCAAFLKAERGAADQDRSSRSKTGVQAAAKWWADNRPSAPGAVSADFAEAVALLADQPGIGTRHLGTRVPDVRRLYLGRIRYFVYYLVTGDELQILALWHESRDRRPSL